jgi:YcaO-like protein with predicted kinase domain
MKFKSSPKIFKNYKSASPKKTVKEAKKFLKKIGLDVDYCSAKIELKDFVVYSGRITCKNKGEEFYLAAGKGITKDLCMASAYAELIERILSNFIIATNFVKVPFRMLKEKDDDKVDVEEFLKHFKIVNSKKDSFVWTEAFSVLENKKVAIPYYFLKTISASNGLAAGNTIEEAFSQAFCEVCERYSNIEHLIKKIPANTIDKKTIHNKRIHRFIKLFESFNFEVEIKDLTLEGKVPVVGVLFTNNNIKKETKVVKDIYYKTLVVGSHFNLEEAIIRCFLEELQGVMCNMSMLIETGKLAYSYGGNNYYVDVFKDYYTKEDYLKILENFKKSFHEESFVNQCSLENFDYMKKGKLISFSELTSIKTKDFLEDIKLIKEILKKNNWKAFIVDHSVKNSSLKVIRLFIPSVSDSLRYFFKEGKTFNDYNHLLKVRSSGNFDEKKGEKMKPHNKYYFLKYHLFPRSLLNWGRPLHLWQLEIVKDLLETAMLMGDRKECKKIKKISDQIIDFDVFLKRFSHKK